jgi:hypothetical protein
MANGEEEQRNGAQTRGKGEVEGRRGVKGEGKMNRPRVSD